MLPRHALRHLKRCIARQQQIALLGPDSTLWPPSAKLRCATTSTRPLKGRIALLLRAISALPESARACFYSYSARMCLPALLIVPLPARSRMPLSKITRHHAHRLAPVHIASGPGDVVARPHHAAIVPAALTRLRQACTPPVCRCRPSGV